MNQELTDLAVEMRRLSLLGDRALQVLREASRDHSQHEHHYRKERGKAWATTAGQGMVVAEREALVDSLTADARLSRDLAAGLERAALEAVRARRQQLSALQSLLAGWREEAAFGRTGPELRP
jgi:hypothetical protein